MAKSAVVSIYEITPGKAQDFIGAMRAQQEWMRGKGSGDMRVWNTIFAGENSGRIITVSEADSVADIGSTADAVMADWENGPMFQAVSKGIATVVSRSVMVDVTEVL